MQDNNLSAAERKRSYISDIGWLFLREYYKTLLTQPENLHKFYNSNSTLSYGSEYGPVTPYIGSESIARIVGKLDFAGNKFFLSTIDTHESLNGGIMLMVVGKIRKNDDEMKNFAHTFFLATQDSGFYILNEIFRYIKFDNESNWEAVEQTEFKENANFTPQYNNVVSQKHLTLEVLFDNKEDPSVQKQEINIEVPQEIKISPKPKPQTQPSESNAVPAQENPTANTPENAYTPPTTEEALSQDQPNDTPPDTPTKTQNEQPTIPKPGSILPVSHGKPSYAKLVAEGVNSFPDPSPPPQQPAPIRQPPPLARQPPLLNQNRKPSRKPTTTNPNTTIQTNGSNSFSQTHKKDDSQYQQRNVYKYNHDQRPRNEEYQHSPSSDKASVYIKGLNENITEDKLKLALSQFGQVVSISMSNGPSRHYGFASFSTPAFASSAVGAVIKIDDNLIRVEERRRTVKPTQRPSSINKPPPGHKGDEQNQDSTHHPHSRVQKSYHPRSNSRPVISQSSIHNVKTSHPPSSRPQVQSPPIPKSDTPPPLSQQPVDNGALKGDKAIDPRQKQKKPTNNNMPVKKPVLEDVAVKKNSTPTPSPIQANNA